MAAYIFDFAAVAQYTPVFVRGVLVTAQLTLVGGALGLGVGTLCAWARTAGPLWLRAIVAAYVELIRNTPFLIQLFFVFYGLPSAGLRLNAMEGALIAMTINLGAYTAEIIRAGIQATPRGQLEAARSLAFSERQLFWRVVIQPAFQRVWPALSSQVTLVMLGSAACSQISVEDVTFAANFIQSRNFRAFESYAVATVIYLALAFAVQQAMRQLGRAWFASRRSRK